MKLSKTAEVVLHPKEIWNEIKGLRGDFGLPKGKEFVEEVLLEGSWGMTTAKYGIIIIL